MFNRRVYALLGCVGLVCVTATRASAQATLAWDGDGQGAVDGYAVLLDGIRTNYGRTAFNSNGACACTAPLAISGGRHIVTVIAYNAFGESSSVPFVIEPAGDAGGPYTGQAGTTVAVSGSASFAPTGTLTQYLWQWGDGTVDTIAATSDAAHTYASAGVFTITLTVTDNAGAATSAATSMTVTTAASDSGNPTAPPETQTPQTPLPSIDSGGAVPPAWQNQDVGHAGRSGGSRRSVSSGALMMKVAGENNGGKTGDIVIGASDIATPALHGAWRKANDTLSPEGIKLWTPDDGIANTSSPLAAPVDYVDVVFTAAANTPYRVWLRLRAAGNSMSNDSVWVQYSDAVWGGSPLFRTGTTAALLVSLATDATGNSLSGWGWQNTAYWLSQPTAVTFATNGVHTLRIQTREDGVEIDQIVLSPVMYFDAAPGPPSNDLTSAAMP